MIFLGSEVDGIYKTLIWVEKPRAKKYIKKVHAIFQFLKKIIEKIIYTIINRPYDWKSNILLYYIDRN